MGRQKFIQSLKRLIPNISETLALEYVGNAENTKRKQDSVKFAEIKIKTAVV